MTNDVITMHDVRFHYRGDWWQRIDALRGVELSVPSGSAFGFLGGNGAGKSTSIKLLLGLLHGYSGSIRLFGEPLGDPHLRARIGYLPEHPYFYEYLSVEEYLDYLGRLSGMASHALAAAKERIYGDLELGDLRRRRLGSFSKGMRQRFGLAQAIIHQPELLILDEPFSGLDPLWRARFRGVLHAERERGATLFFSSHILADVEELCDHYALIDQGRVIEQQPLSALLREAPMQIVARGPQPEAAQDIDERSDGQWLWSFPATERHAALAACAAAGSEVLRLESQRLALEDYFVERVGATQREGAS